MDKDALFAQMIDSDFANGNTDGDGWVFRAGYAPVKNIMLNATYFMNRPNKDVAPVTTPTNEFDKDLNYDRLATGCELQVLTAFAAKPSPGSRPFTARAAFPGNARGGHGWGLSLAGALAATPALLYIGAVPENPWTPQTSRTTS